MRIKKNVHASSSDLQAQFTAYLVTAIHNKKLDILSRRIRKNNLEADWVANEDKINIIPMSESDPEITTMDEVEFENHRLENAIQGLNDRDRYVLFARTLADKSFEELARELDLSYKGTAAIYYRAMKKIRDKMGGDPK